MIMTLLILKTQGKFPLVGRECEKIVWWYVETIWVAETLFIFTAEKKLVILKGSARGIIVIVVGSGHGDTSSNPGRDWLHFT